MDRKIKIAIIDSGVKTNHPVFLKDKFNGFQFSKKGITNNYEDEYGHGTAVYSIIRKCNDVADIINIKLENINDGVEQCSLQILLDYICKNERIDIINLRLGLDICDDFQALRDVIRRIA